MGVTNLWPEQYAGAHQSDSDVPSYISGYVDGEGCFIPHFMRYPLLSGKRKDLELFADICRRMVRGEHRSVAGLSEIVHLAGTMNPSGKRGYVPANIIEALMR